MYRRSEEGVGTEKIIISLSQILKMLSKVFYCIHCDVTKSKVAAVNSNT